MKNWRILADAYGLGVPESELDRVVLPLDVLEKAFRPLAGSFPSDADSALIFEAAPEPK